MKKIFVLLLALAIGISMVACGGSDKDAKEGAKEAPKEDVKKVEKSVDAVAAELGLEGGEETFYSMIGAVDGKEYNDGKIEIYKFDVDGEDYKRTETAKEINGAPVILNDGMVLMFTDTQDDEMVKKFQALKFK